MVTGHVVLFLQDASRGHQVIKEIFEDYKGILLSDFWTAYNKLDVEQQKCLAHLVKDLRNMAHDAAKRGEKARKRLAEAAKAEITSRSPPNESKRGRPRKAPELLTAKQRSKLEAEVEECNKFFSQVEKLREFFKLAWGDSDMGYVAPVEARITKDEAIRRMHAIIDDIRDEGSANADVDRIIKRMEKFAPCLFTYLDHLGIPPDNNPAERALRHFVVQRKVSGNFISDKALEIYAMHLSFYETCIKQGVNYNDLLGMLLNGKTLRVMDLLGLPSNDPPPWKTVESN
ncbi:MAG: IS66 family transposase [Promethearchaeota archaeon]